MPTEPSFPVENPFAAPTVRAAPQPVELDPNDPTEEGIPQRYRSRHAAILIVAKLFALAAFWRMILVSLQILELKRFGEQPLGAPEMWLLVILMTGAWGFLDACLAIGLHRLQAWARWTAIGLVLFGLITMAGSVVTMMKYRAPGLAILPLIISAPITLAILYILATRPTGTVFSAKYREIVGRAHFTPQTNWAVLVPIVLIDSIPPLIQIATRLAR